MNNFDTYFLMDASQVADYVKAKLPDFFDSKAQLVCKEIGDGNLNYVFRLSDENSGKSIIIKQAAEELRISKELKLSTDRGRIEAAILTLQNKYAQGMVPKVYFYDEVMCAMIMEDMVGHSMMRTALIDQDIFPKFADQISTFLVNTLLLTSDIVMNHKEKKELVKEFINPDLCDLSESLVYTEPYLNNNNRNNVFVLNKDFVEKEIYEDKKLHLTVANYKLQFMTNAEALIHGDLHTGSIFINEDHIFVFDPEFAFFGPMSYDIGNVIANLFFAYCHADAETNEKSAEFKAWILDSISNIIDMFAAKFKKAWAENVSDPLFKTDIFLEQYLSKVLEESAAIAGIETIRRTVGMANVKDITSISDDDKRARAERILITLAKDYIFNASTFQTGNSYKEAIDKAIKAFS